MNKMYFENDVPANEVRSKGLDQKNVVVFGYGSQGRGQALNLRDSGVQVQVALRPGGPSWVQACEDGWSPVDVATAAQDADVLCLLVPDMVQPQLLEQSVFPFVKPGATLMFAHGFNVRYQFVSIPENLNVAMVAPKGPGSLVRREYRSGSGVPCLIAIEQDATGDAFDTALAYAAAIGGTRAGVIETTFTEETETDLFGEQAVLCGGVTELVVAGWETLVEAGYSPEIAYFECMHELKLIVDLLHEGGLSKMLRFVSDTAKYGDLTRGKRIVDTQTRERMKEVLSEIQDGSFAREWRAEYESGESVYRELLQQDLDHPIEKVGKALRSHFSWLNSKEIESRPARAAESDSSAPRKAHS